MNTLLSRFSTFSARRRWSFRWSNNSSDHPNQPRHESMISSMHIKGMLQNFLMSSPYYVITQKVTWPHSTPPNSHCIEGEQPACHCSIELLHETSGHLALTPKGPLGSPNPRILTCHQHPVAVACRHTFLWPLVVFLLTMESDWVSQAFFEVMETPKENCLRNRWTLEHIAGVMKALAGTDGWSVHISPPHVSQLCGRGADLGASVPCFDELGWPPGNNSKTLLNEASVDTVSSLARCEACEFNACETSPSLILYLIQASRVRPGNHGVSLSDFTGSASSSMLVYFESPSLSSISVCGCLW